MASVVPVEIPVEDKAPVLVEDNAEVNHEDNAEVNAGDEFYYPSFELALKIGNESHIRWLLTSEIIRKITKYYKGVVFGGAVRDMILHDNAAEKFYKLCSDKPAYNDPKLYNDPTLYPELSDRFLVPNDIDFFITHSEYKEFKKYLYRRGFYYRELYKKDLTYLNQSLSSYGKYTLTSVELIYYNKVHKNTYIVMLDAILCYDTVLPQMDKDFSVNKLYITHNGMAANEDCKWTYDEIRQHILNKEAHCDSTISDKRYKKMNKPGWKLIINYTSLQFKLRTNEEEETCVICLEDLKVGELEVKTKTCKCNYSYCKECINTIIKSNKCLMCKTETSIDKKMCDIKMFKLYQLYK